MKKATKWRCVNGCKICNVSSAVLRIIKVSAGILSSRLGTTESWCMAYGLNESNKNMHKCGKCHVWGMNERNTIATLGIFGEFMITAFKYVKQFSEQWKNNLYSIDHGR